MRKTNEIQRQKQANRQAKLIRAGQGNEQREEVQIRTRHTKEGLQNKTGNGLQARKDETGSKSILRT